ncbi:MAG: acetate kinase [Legionellales bacterium]|nr:acetate kinase [Legionellales bacterium]
MKKTAVLIFNCGSSSIKFALINPENEKQYIKGLAECLNTPDARIVWQINEEKNILPLENANYAQAIESIFLIIDEKTACEIIAVGHRVVHGGEQFSQSVIITEEVIDAIRHNIQLAPLHNPANLAGILAVKKQFPTLKQVAVFDTAFHQTLPEKNYLYPIPLCYYEQYKIRKYGFHGISHKFIVQQAALRINKPLQSCQFITAHLGNGASVAASIGGKSIDTSMGFTPLAGLMMGTRSGDIDPGIHAFLCEKENKSVDEITQALNKASGLLGISECSMDMRTLSTEAKNGNTKAQLAIDMFCDRLAKIIAAQAMNLQRIDALIFTGGIGENDIQVRHQVLSQLSLLGFKVDETLNIVAGADSDGRISASDSTLALVIATNEELLIAKDTFTLMN